MGYELEFVNKGPVLNGAFSGDTVSSNLNTIKLISSEPCTKTIKHVGPVEVTSYSKEWMYEYREFWFRNKSYGAWVTVGTSKEAFNTLSAGYAMENLIGKD